MTSQGLQVTSDIDTPPPFLRVEQSARGNRWVERLTDGQKNIALAIAQTLGISDILSRILAARGSNPDTVHDDLNPTLKRLMPDPSSLQDMDKAADRFVRAILVKEKIAVFGDYDVDGASSTALVVKFLQACGQTALIYIPDRQLEGYGPNVPAFEQLCSDGANLIITVDCGTVSTDPISRSNELGTDVIVLDHHQADENLPPAHAIVNPNRQDDMSGQTHLAAVGVVFLFLVATARKLREQNAHIEGLTPATLMEWLDLVALGTVCDVVPLIGLNRAYVKRGLEVLHGRSNEGLRALCDAAGLTEAPTPYHLGFVLGPRLNAGGRIGRSGLAARLLTSTDSIQAMEIAADLDALNAERQHLQQQQQDEAIAQADTVMESAPDTPVVVAHGEGWHKGLVGLIASRLVERFERPALVIAWEKDGTGAGSARSIPGVDLGAAIRLAVEQGHLVRGGGHTMAAGFTVMREKAEAFFSWINESLQKQVMDSLSARTLKIDAALMASSATQGLMDNIETAGPFGAGNPQPRFAFAAHRCRYPKIVGEKHVRCTVTANDGSRIDAIAFNSADTPVGQLLLASNGASLHFAGRLRRNDWGGRQKIELHIEDVAIPR